jgi:diguanylate cyclase (GGDEF)-like protein
MFFNIKEKREHVSFELNLIDKQVEKINFLRNNLIVLQNVTDHYLLDPTLGDIEDQIKKHIDDSLQTIASLETTALLEHNHEIDTRSITAQYRQLKVIIQELFEIRLDVERQYPGMALSAFEMGDVQDEIEERLLVMISEIESDAFTPVSSELYPLILKTQTTWTALVSQMRIYLANRLASFSTEILVSQAASVEDIKQVLVKNLSKLKSIYETEEDSFEGLSSVEVITKALNNWLDLFAKVRSLSESPQWRQDWNLMESDIIPLTKSINQSLQDLEAGLNTEERMAAEGLQNNINQVFIVLATIIALVALLIVGIIVSMNIMVFEPILNVASALRLKAFGQEIPDFSHKQSEETQILIDAFEEMDHQVSQRQDALEHQALHDSLTSLPNRFLLNERLDYLTSTAKRNHTQFSLLVMDLDNFKDINDSLGHQVGDAIIIETAKRLQSSMTSSETLARFAGDEFAVILEDTPKEKASARAGILHELVKVPHKISGNIIQTDLSIGIAGFPDDVDEGQTLLQYADVAMQYAKNKNLEYAFYDPETDEYTLGRLSLAKDLTRGLAKDELELYFQPQLDLENKKVRGAEALLRWNHAKHGFIRPDRIIDLAIQSDLINDLSNWVIEKAIKACRDWHDSGYLLEVSINITVENLNYPHLQEKISSYLDKYKIEPHFIMLEITENSMMTNPGRSVDVLKQLSDLGVRISVDDFGTGFSSLSYLQRLPVHEVKIDKSFVMNMDANENNKTIVESVISLGHKLGLSVVAEGIETNKVLTFLKVLNCNCGQGYLISKPIGHEDFIKWLKKHINQPIDIYPQEKA